MNDNVILRVNGRDWSGWSDVRIAAGIERVARDFSLTITRQWPGQPVPPEAVKNGDAVEVLIGSDRVLSGWVEATPVAWQGNAVTMSLSGRSKTADLIDCAALPVQHTGQTLFAIASALAEPFAITVVNQGASDALITDAQAEHGETVIGSLHRLTGRVPALIWDNADGQLVLGGVGGDKAATALVLGENILTASAQQSVAGRFSHYLVTGQRPGNDEDFAETTLAAIKHSAGDSGVTRYRPTTIQLSGAATTAGCQARADFESAQRSAKTRQATYTVQGWRQGNGTLWQPNQQVVVWDPLSGFDNQTLVIGEVVYTLNDKGTITSLSVAPAAAYLPVTTGENAQ